MTAADDILAFWFGTGDQAPGTHSREVWFKKSSAFDAEVTARWKQLFERAVRGELAKWAQSPRSALALILVLDQFPRNIFRDSARAFASDARALEIARESIARGFDRQLAPVERWFVYMPFEHAEMIDAQTEALRLFTQLRDETGLSEPLLWAQKHHEVVARFGRFPHRNALLGRASTPEEAVFLRQPGSHF